MSAVQAGVSELRYSSGISDYRDPVWLVKRLSADHTKLLSGGHYESAGCAKIESTFLGFPRHDV